MTKTQTYAVAALIAAAFTAQAGTTSKAPTTPSTPPTAQTALEGSFGVDVTTGYTFKGVRVDTKPSTQPYLNLSLPLTVGAYGIDSASVNVATRQFSNPNAVVNDWYRSEISAGVTLNSGSFSVTPSFHQVNSPNSKVGSSQAVDLTVGYRGLLGLNPHASVYQGLNGTPGGGSDSGTAYEVGVTPSVTVSKVYNTTFALPVNVGYGANNFYANDQKFGYTSAGLSTKTPLLKNVFLNTGVTYYNTKDTLNPGNKDHWTAKAGLGVEF